MIREEMPALKFPGRRAMAACMAASILVISLLPRLLPAQAMMRPVNLAYLVKRADVIVQGRITGVVRESLPGYPNIPTVRVTMDVDAMMRGPERATYTFRELQMGLRAKGNKTNYRVGQQVVLFLPSPSELGLSSPIGLEQGRFHISRDAAGQAIVANELGNAGLFNGVAQDARNEGRKLPPNQLRLVSGTSGPVNLSEFVSLVKNLKSLSRIQDQKPNVD